MPIRGQKPGHGSTLDQSEASIKSCDLSLVCNKSQKRKIKFSNNCPIFWGGVKIYVLNLRPVSVRQNRSRATFPGVSWKVIEGHRKSWKVKEGQGRSWKVMGHYWCHLISPINSCNSCNKLVLTRLGVNRVRPWI